MDKLESSTRALALQEGGQVEEAARIFRQILLADHRDFVALYSLGVIAVQAGEASQALWYFERAARSNPQFAQTWFNRGVVLHSLGRSEEALASYDQALALNPNYTQAASARTQLRETLHLPPSTPSTVSTPSTPALSNLLLQAIALQEQGDLLAAESLLAGIIVQQPANFAALYSLGVLAHLRGEPGQALDYIDRALQVNPGYAPAWYNRGTVLQAMKRGPEALASYDRALALDPGSAETLVNRGVVLQELDRHHEALENYTRLLAADPGNVKALGNMGIILTEFKRYEEAIALFVRLLARDPEYDYALGLLAFAQLHICQWEELAARSRAISAGIAAGKRVCKTLALLALNGDPGEQLACARIFARHLYPPQPPVWRGERYNHRKIRLAYVSPDFREHPVGHLMAGIFEHHDRQRFELTAISLGIDDGSPLRSRIAAAFDRFIDGRRMASRELAGLLRSLEIDIAIDLAGYTADSRTDLFSCRPAPLQVNFLGYPGTLGVEYMDYLLADREVIPESEQEFFSEKIVYLPGAYLPADDRPRPAAETPTRAGCGLPAQGVVFCSFNHAYKLNPEIFSCWLRILAEVEGSVLWLMKLHEGAEENLRREAGARGIDPARLCFATRVPKVEEHLARYRLADLFLDTLPYNAHTTASDALMAGLPVLTCRGRAFPGRVAASLLQAIGLPELIADSLADYQARAVALARDPAALPALREKLARNRESYPLFNTARFARNLEAAYTLMQERQERGEKPASFAVPAPAEGTIVLDAVFFQLARSGIARVWETLLREWAGTPLAARLLILDRQSTAPRIPGYRYLEAGGYDYSQVEADRARVQEICDREGAVLFISTYYSTPVTTPSLLVVYDMIPERLAWDLTQPMWREKQRALSQAVRYVCISEATATDLKRFQGVAPERVTVSHCGVGAEFKPAGAGEIGEFRRRYRLEQPYLLLVGERGAHKNIGLFFRALKLLRTRPELAVLCLGGQPELEPEFAALAGTRPVRHLRLPDSEMRAAYAGAVALVYPSLCEGFGLPVVEAMACGCPVIACRSAALVEVAGERVLYVSSSDERELAAAIRAVRKPALRRRLAAGGLAASGRYSWARMAAELAEAITAATRAEGEPAGLCRQAESLFLQIKGDPYDPGGPEQLAAFRAQVARCLLAAGPELEKLVAGPLGRVHGELIAAGAAQIPLGAEEEPLLGRIAAILGRDPNAPDFLAAWAAVMLYATPARLSPLPPVASMPAFLRECFRGYCYAAPRHFREAGEVEAYGQYYTALLAGLRRELEERPGTPEGMAAALAWVNRGSMIPLYFTRSSLLEAQRDRAFLLERVVGGHASSPGLAYRFPARAGGTRTRLGVLAAHFRPQTETYATIPVYRDLDRGQFEVVLISQTGWGEDPLEQYCAALGERTVSLSQELGADVRAIRELDLDLLWIGTNLTAVMNYMVQLAVHRLARLQVVGGCCPVTTGFAEIDLFVSGRETEMAEAGRHYSEKLLLVEGPAHCFDLGGEEPASGPAPERSSLGLAEEAVVYVSGANYFKIVPELLAAWLEILRQVPGSRMILFPFNPNWSSSYPAASFILHLERAARAAGFAANPFLVVKPVATRGDIVALLRLADLYLDSFPYSGMTSILEPYAAGLPLVVWEGEFQRERMAASALRALRLDDWICASPAEYVLRAVGWGREPAAREQARRRLALAKLTTPKFLDPAWYGGEVARLLTGELALRRHEGGL